MLRLTGNLSVEKAIQRKRKRERSKLSSVYAKYSSAKETKIEWAARPARVVEVTAQSETQSRGAQGRRSRRGRSRAQDRDGQMAGGVTVETLIVVNCNT